MTRPTNIAASIASKKIIDAGVGRTRFDNENPTPLSAARALFNVIPDTKVAEQFLPKTKIWWLLNVDRGEHIYGQFEASDVNESVSATYSNTFALNRQKAITQFLHGNVETISFQARFYALFALQDIESIVQKLKEWTRRDQLLGRPPILCFWVGNQHVKLTTCVMTNVDVKYDPPGFLGSMQGATVSIQLQKYDPYSLADITNFDTRYHYVKLGDTYEMLAAREYGNPMLGVELRQRHPHMRVLQPGNIVKLPAPTGSIRRAKIEPKSIALKTILGRKATQQVTNLQNVFKERSGSSIIFKV